MKGKKETAFQNLGRLFMNAVQNKLLYQIDLVLILIMKI